MCGDDFKPSVQGTLGRLVGLLVGTTEDLASGQANLEPQVPVSNVPLTTGQAADLAKYNGYDSRVKNPPFDSHGQPVFSNGKNFITPDVDSHKGGVWKMFSRRGRRVGTFNETLDKQID